MNSTDKFTTAAVYVIEMMDKKFPDYDEAARKAILEIASAAYGAKLARDAQIAAYSTLFDRLAR